MKRYIHFQVFAILFLSFLYQYSFAQCNPAGSGTNGAIYCMYQDTASHCLYLGGDFHNSGNDTMNHCSFWNDTSYWPMNMMGHNGVNDSVWCFTYFNGSLYVGGSFRMAGGINCNRIARWDGTSWYPVGDGFNETVHTLGVYNNELYAGGEFELSGSTQINHIGRWDGLKWVQVSDGMNDDVESFCVWNGALYIGGKFTQAGGLTVNRICSWNGTIFSAVGSGFTHGMMGQCSVNSLCVYNGNLCAGGRFEHAGSMQMRNISMWNGAIWTSMGEIEGGMQGQNGVQTMCVYDGSLFVGGNFGSCGSANANNLGVWNGSSWTNIGTGMNGKVFSLAVYNDNLYIGGSFTNAAGISVNNIARYSTTTGIVVVQPSAISLKLNPNPASDFVQVNWMIERLTRVSLVVSDVNGRMISQQWIDVVSPGIQQENISVKSLSDGIYYFTINTGHELYTAKFLVNK